MTSRRRQASVGPDRSTDGIVGRQRAVHRREIDLKEGVALERRRCSEVALDEVRRAVPLEVGGKRRVAVAEGVGGHCDTVIGDRVEEVGRRADRRDSRLGSKDGE